MPGIYPFNNYSTPHSNMVVPLLIAAGISLEAKFLSFKYM